MLQSIQKGLVLVGLVCFSNTVWSQASPADCCYDCTCAYCADIASCSGPIVSEAECSRGGAEVCGVDHPTTTCSTFWENNTEGVQSDTPQPTDPNGCIPIDGGLGFLIAGGLGIGVLGIRRRREELELERG